MLCDMFHFHFVLLRVEGQACDGMGDCVYIEVLVGVGYVLTECDMSSSYVTFINVLIVKFLRRKSN